MKQDYYKTKKGVITRIYISQKSRSKLRGHDLPSYSKKELYEWMYSQKLFHELFDTWKLSNYNKMNKPSIDRIDDSIGYTMGNIQLMTWQENINKSCKDRLTGIDNRNNKSINQYTEDMKFIATFYSMQEACRQTGVACQNISATCRGKLHKAGGYIWKYK